MHKYMKGDNVPRAIGFPRIGMINAVPPLFHHLLPPRFIPFIAGHDDVFHSDTSRFTQLRFDLFDAPSNYGNRREALLHWNVAAPIFEIAVADMDTDVLKQA